MHTIVVVIHVIVSLALVSIVLLQHGKGAGIGAAFGGSSQTVFGSTGAAPFLAKLTAIVAILFMCTSLGLTFMGRQQAPSVMQGAGKPAATQPAPATPGPAHRLRRDRPRPQANEHPCAEVVEPGRHAILRGWWGIPVRVQIPPSAPYILIKGVILVGYAFFILAGCG